MTTVIELMTMEQNWDEMTCFVRGLEDRFGYPGLIRLAEILQRQERADAQAIALWVLSQQQEIEAEIELAEITRGMGVV